MLEWRTQRRVAACVLATVGTTTLVGAASFASAQTVGREDVSIEFGFDTAVFESVRGGPDRITFRGLDRYASIEEGTRNFPIRDAITVMQGDADQQVSIDLVPDTRADDSGRFHRLVLSKLRAEKDGMTADVEVIGEDGAPLPDDAPTKALPRETTANGAVAAIVDSPDVAATAGSPVSVALESTGFEDKQRVHLAHLGVSCIEKPSKTELALGPSASHDSWTFTWTGKSGECPRGGYQIVYLYRGKDVTVIIFFSEVSANLFAIQQATCTPNATCRAVGGINKLMVDVTKK
jgi:hypothetical protein